MAAVPPVTSLAQSTVATLAEALRDRGARQIARHAQRGGSSRWRMANGVVLHPDGLTSGDADPLRGYSLIEAETRDEALELLRDVS